jgi:hypothetical protein
MAMSWKKIAFAVLLLSALAGAVIPIVQAQAPAVDPAAVQILKRMTDYMAGLQHFSVHSDNTLEDQLDSGQRVDFGFSAKVTLSRPDKLHAARVGGLEDQELIYDGKTVTMFNPSDGVYARKEITTTVPQMIDYLREELGVMLPGSDLIYPNAFDLIMSGATAATVVGKSAIAGTVCHHLAFSRPDVDVQVWVAEGDRPLPCKYVVTDKSTPELISTVTVWSEWEVDSAPPDSEFDFVAPAGAQAITFMPPVTTGDAGQ